MTSSPLFLVPILAGLIAQALKPLFNKTWYHHLSKAGKHIPRYGGMPSAHTAFATSLATVVALVDGLYTTSFMIALSLVIFVLDDALRMRIFLSRHGLALRKLVDRLPAEDQKRYPYLETRLGHKGREVLVGAILGVVVTVGIWLLYNGVIKDYLTSFFEPVH